MFSLDKNCCWRWTEGVYFRELLPEALLDTMNLKEFSTANHELYKRQLVNACMWQVLASCFDLLVFILEKTNVY